MFDLLVGSAIVLTCLGSGGCLYFLYQIHKRNKRLDKELYQMEEEEVQYRKLRFD